MLPPIPRLEDYDISEEYGFLPTEPPLDRLPDSYYSPWEHIISNLQALILSKRLRNVVDGLTVLGTSRLESRPEWRRAYMMLGFMAHAYIWTGDRPSDRLPPQITVPLLSTAKYFSLPPVATYAGLVLWNWRRIVPDASSDDPSNLYTLTTFTGSLDESWFYLISVAMESIGGPSIPLMLRAISAVREDDMNTVIYCLQCLAETIDSVGTLLERMFENCDPRIFYTRIRPFLAGSKNMGDAGLPHGVLYDDGTPNSFYRQYSGGSNAESSLIQFFDVVLGVEHRPTGEVPSSGAARLPPARDSPKSHSFLADMRSYMPGSHARFLADLSAVQNIAEYVHTHRACGPLTISYDACLHMLGTLRDKHLRIVSRYIVIPSRAAKDADSGLADSSKQVRPPPINLAAATSGASAGLGLKKMRGTGGTALIPFLKQVRDETREPAIGTWAKRLLTNSPATNLALRERAEAAEADDTKSMRVARLPIIDEHANGVIEVVGLAGTWSLDGSEGGICHW